MSPATVEEQHKEVYAHFGAAAARASDFEIVLTNILFVNAKRSGRIVTEEDFEKMEMKLNKSRKTLGPLITDVNAEVAIPDETKNAMSEALKRRNYLIHHFFRDKAFEFATEAGRKGFWPEWLEATPSRTAL